jgi:hypothetical protein
LVRFSAEIVFTLGSHRCIDEDPDELWDKVEALRGDLLQKLGGYGKIGLVGHGVISFV